MNISAEILESELNLDIDKCLQAGMRSCLVFINIENEFALHLLVMPSVRWP